MPPETNIESAAVDWSPAFVMTVALRKSEIVTDGGARTSVRRRIYLESASTIYEYCSRRSCTSRAQNASVPHSGNFAWNW